MDAVAVGVFGPVRLRLGDDSPAPLRGSAARLVGTLVVRVDAGTPIDRDRLAFTLWPDRSESSARRALTDAIYRLRTALDSEVAAELLVVATDTVALGAVDTDLAEFRRDAASDDPQRWDRALERSTEPLLANLDEEWLSGERAAIERQRAELFAALVDHHRRRRAPHDVVDTARRWAGSAPLDEDAHAALIAALAENGELDDALEHGDRLVAQFADELGIAPSPPIAELLARLGSERELVRDARPATAPPFVGRRAERRRLLHVVDRALAGDGGLAVVLGDAGIGKSRLLDEIAASATLRGATVGRAAGSGDDSVNAYAPLLDAVGLALPAARRELLADIVGAIWIRQLDAVAPVAAAAASHGAIPDPVPVDAVDVPVLLEQLLPAMAVIGPHVILLDDLHRAGSETWTVIERLTPLVERLAIAVVVTARAVEVRRDRAAWLTITRWDTESVPVIELPPLDADELSELVTVTAPDLPAAVIDEVATASGGNPLVAIALASDSDGSTLATTVTPGEQLIAVVERRLGTLSDDAVRAAEVAAVLGDRFPFAIWQRVAAHEDVASIVAAVGELERAQLVVVADDGFRFGHQLIWEAIDERVGAARRATLHTVALAAYDDLRAGDLAACLRHAIGAGDRAAIGAYSLEAAIVAMRTASLATARRHLDRALEHLESDDPLHREALLAAIDVMHRQADHDGERAAIDRLAELGGNDDPVGAATVAVVAADADLAIGELDVAIERIDAARRQLGSPEDDDETAASLRGRLEMLAAALSRSRGDLAATEQAAERAAVAYRRAGDPAGLATVTDLLGGLAWQRGDHATAITLHREAADRYRGLGLAGGLSQALNNLGSALWSAGDLTGAAEVHREALELCRALGDRRTEGDNIDNLGGVAFARGDYDTAIEQYQAALDLRREIDDVWGVTISLSNLGDAYRCLGDHQRALDCFAESIEVNERAGVVRNETTTRQSIGLTLLDSGRVAAALDLLVAVAARHAELDDHANRQETMCGIASARQQLGDIAGADATIRTVLGDQHADDRAELRQLVHITAHEVFTASGDEDAVAQLVAAADAQAEVVAALDPADRRRVLDAVPLQRRTSAWAKAASRIELVELASTDAPRGRATTAEQRRLVRWTVERPGDDRSTASGRGDVLRRLLAEAEEQGAAPTDDDLAAVLGVSRRTVLRLVEALRAAGHRVATRSRR